MLRGGIDIERLSKLPLQYFKSVEIDDAKAQTEGTIWKIPCSTGSIRVRANFLPLSGLHPRR